MQRVFLLALVSCLVWGSRPSVGAAEEYQIDPQHTSVTFKILHLGIAWVHGRFSEVAGTVTIDAEDRTKSAFVLTIPVTSIDTNVEKRDAHLRSADFFDADKYPELSFRSTQVESILGGFRVTGDVTLHGVTRPLTFDLIGGKTAEFPPQVHRIGYSTSFVLKRSEFQMNFIPGAIGDEIYAEVSFEAIQK